jgi:hypothetical protein
MLNVGTQIPVYKTRCLIFRLKYLTVNSTRDIYLILHAQHGQRSSSLTLHNGTVDSPSIQAACYCISLLYMLIYMLYIFNISYCSLFYMDLDGWV